MTVLIDTNVVLDILLHREPWYANSALLVGLANQGIIKVYVTASSITDIFYIVQKQQGKSAAKTAIKQVLRAFYPSNLSRPLPTLNSNRSAPHFSLLAPTSRRHGEDPIQP